MPGANYMGGRWNAAKAKSKDKTIRAQKDFFGRRRLNILSRGLYIPFKDNRHDSSSRLAARVSIDLSHAKKPLSTNNTNNEAITTTTPESVENSRKRKRDQDTGTSLARTPTSSSPYGRSTEGTSSTKRVKSKLLRELDLLEPISTNAAISQILSMPDFVGLSSPVQESLSSKSRPSSLLQDTSQKHKQVDTLEDEFSDYVVNAASPLLSYLSTSQVHNDLSSIHIPETGPHSGAKSHSGISSRHSLPSGTYSASTPSRVKTGTIVLKWIIPPKQLTPLIATSESSSSISSYSQHDPSPSSPSSPQGQTRQLNQVNSTGNEEALSDCSLGYGRKTDDLQEHKNLLDFSDPWAQIGILLGIPDKDLQKEHSEIFKNQYREETRRVDSELPPSDIVFDLEGSSDDMSFAGTAGSSFLKADFSDTEFSLQSWNTSEQQRHDIGFISDPQSHGSLLDFDDVLYMDNIFDASPGLQASRDIQDETDPGRVEEGERPFGEILDKNSLKGMASDVPVRVILQLGNSLEHSEQVSDAEFTGKKRMEESAVISGNGLLATSLEDSNRVSRDEIKRANKGVLRLPELEEYGGFYRGPSLFSDGSDCSEL